MHREIVEPVACERRSGERGFDPRIDFELVDGECVEHGEQLAVTPGGLEVRAQSSLWLGTRRRRATRLERGHGACWIAQSVSHVSASWRASLRACADSGSRASMSSSVAARVW